MKAEIENSSLELLGKRIAKARKEAGITQNDAAKGVGLSRQTYFEIEKGKRTPRQEELDALVILLGKTQDYFLGPPETDPVEQQVSYKCPAGVELGKSCRTAACSAFQKLTDFARLYCELESTLGIVRISSNADLLPKSKMRYAVELGEQFADKERCRLGISGKESVRDLQNILEVNTGTRILIDAFDPSLYSVFGGNDAYSSQP